MKISLMNYSTQMTNRGVNFKGLNPSNGIAARVAETVRHTPFQNLGDSAEKNYPAEVNVERVEAGLDKLSADVVKSDRRWYYWNVNSKPLSMEIAAKLNEVAGGEIRAFGFAGGMDKKMLERWALDEKGVTSWHIDTKEGLKLLTQTLQNFFGGAPVQNILKALSENAGKFSGVR